MWTYKIMRGGLRLAARVFYRQIQVVGEENIAPEGQRAVMLAGNHPNSLLDPLLILATTDRVVHFAAKDVLFKNPLLRQVLHAVGAVAVARVQDHGPGGGDNSGAFGQLSQVLAGGGAMGIFPEGLSHDGAELSKLKTGAARIAFDVVKRYDQPVDIVPCGLTYFAPKHFRSRVLVQYGPPVTVGQAEVERWLRDERAEVIELTEKIDLAMRGLTVNASDWETVRLLDAVRRLYQPPGISLWQRVELARRFNENYPKVKDLPIVEAFTARITAYQARLDALQLSDRDLQRQFTLGEVTRRLYLFATDSLIWAPLAVPGLLLQTPVAALIHWASPKVTPRRDVLGTTKFVLGIVTIPLFYGAFIGVGLVFGGPKWAVVVALLMLLSGYAALRTLEHGVRVRKMVATFWRMVSLRREVAELRSERDVLQLETIRLVDRLRPADLEPLFPRAPADNSAAHAGGSTVPLAPEVLVT